jgi:hypothetical protein
VVDVVQEKQAVLGIHALRGQREEDQQQMAVVQEPHVVVIDTKTSTVVMYLGSGSARFFAAVVDMYQTLCPEKGDSGTF